MASENVVGETKPNKKVVLKNYVIGYPKESDMEIVSTESVRLKVPEGSKAVLLKNLYLSCDPYMRSRMSKHDAPSYVPDFVLGSAISGHGVGKVLDSTHPDFKVGDYVLGMTRWEEYSLITSPEQLFKIKYTDVPPSYYTGLLGMTGFTAYVGFYEICAPKKGEYVLYLLPLVLLASLLGNLLNYWAAMWLGVLDPMKRYFPEGLDIYFDNVGGAMLDAVLLNMRVGARIAACGMISQYNLEKSEGIRNLMMLIVKRARMEGFLISDYHHQYYDFVEKTIMRIKEGKITYIEDVAEGLENAPAALIGLFSGRNVGKQLVVVGRE